MCHNLIWGQRTYIMGILNVTPDSFSGDGLFSSNNPRNDTKMDWLSAAVAQAQAFESAGADIIDIGGESSRPGSKPISPDEEINRVLSVVKAVKAHTTLLISVDTYRAEVAKAVLDVGADWINDIWGLRMDPELPHMIARRGCPIVIMHNRLGPRDAKEAARLAGQPVGKVYPDLLADVSNELQYSIDIALNSGIQESQIIIDPGAGFGKTMAQSLQLIDQLDYFKALGYPILLGTSRKGFIGHALDLPVDERDEGTAATVAIGIDRGADIVRVHDVKGIARMARMTDCIVR